MLSIGPILMFIVLLFMATPKEINAEGTVIHPAYSMNAKEIECMAQNIYYEASDEPYEGKLAVATVTMNRVEHPRYPQTVCEVVFQPWQFSWTMFPRNPITDTEEYAEAQRIAREVIYEEKRLASIGESMYYHNQTVSPKWSLTMFPIRRIGEHTFYVERRPQ